MANCKADGTIYEADGTILHVCYGSSGPVKAVTFIPSQYVEQGDRKFVVFVPHASSDRVVNAVVKDVVKADESDESNSTANGVELDYAGNNFDAPLLHAALHRTKVTVFVSVCGDTFILKGITIPAIPKKPSTARART